MLTDSQKVKQVELKLDGKKIYECVFMHLDDGYCIEWSGRIFRSFALNDYYYKACNKHVQEFERKKAVFIEVL